MRYINRHYLSIALYCKLADGGGGRGDVLHHVKREGELSRRGMSGGICPGEMTGSPPRRERLAGVFYLSVSSSVIKLSNTMS